MHTFFTWSQYIEKIQHNYSFKKEISNKITAIGNLISSIIINWTDFSVVNIVGNDVMMCSWLGLWLLLIYSELYLPVSQLY